MKEVFDSHVHCNIIHNYHEKKETLSFARTWMHLKGIMLSQISQREKNK